MAFLAASLAPGYRMSTAGVTTSRQDTREAGLGRLSLTRAHTRQRKVQLPKCRRCVPLRSPQVPKNTSYNGPEALKHYPPALLWRPPPD